MDTVLWVVQWVLAVAFLVSGAMKAVLPERQLRANPQMAWIEDTGIGQARAAGIAEVLAAFGLVLPGLTDTATILTPLAATGLVIVMALAARVHLGRGETQMVAVNVVLGLLAALVTVGRFFVEPLAA